MENELFGFISKYITLLENEKKVMLELALFKTYEKGKVVLKRGDFSRNRYFVVKGCLRSYYIIDGEEKTTALFTESESFAPHCIVTNQPIKHYVSCVEHTIVLISKPEMEETLFFKYPRFGMLFRMLSEAQLAKNQASFDEFRISTPEERYLNLVQTRPDLLQRIPQYQLASYLGITPQSLSRIRNRIVKKPVHFLYS